MNALPEELLVFMGDTLLEEAGKGWDHYFFLKKELQVKGADYSEVAADWLDMQDLHVEVTDTQVQVFWPYTRQNKIKGQALTKITGKGAPKGSKLYSRT